jgi:hypothetical protein
MKSSAPGDSRGPGIFSTACNLDEHPFLLSSFDLLVLSPQSFGKMDESFLISGYERVGSGEY